MSASAKRRTEEPAPFGHLAAKGPQRLVVGYRVEDRTELLECGHARVRGTTDAKRAHRRCGICALDKKKLAGERKEKKEKLTRDAALRLLDQRDPGVVLAFSDRQMQLFPDSLDVSDRCPVDVDTENVSDDCLADALECTACCAFARCERHR